MSDSGFRVVGERPLYEGPFTSLVELEVESPAGERFHRQVVRHPGAACVVALLDDDRVVLVRQYRAPVDDLLLELPAGLLDVDGEDPADCAARELVEETGYQAAHLEHLVSFCSSPGGSDERVHIYLATGLRRVASAPGLHEEAHMTVETVALAATPAMIADGRIVNGAAVIGLTLAWNRLRPV